MILSKKIKATKCLVSFALIINLRRTDEFRQLCLGLDKKRSAVIKWTAVMIRCFEL